MELLLVLAVLAMVIYLALTRLVLPQRCPGCGRSRVQGRDGCPFCHTPYRSVRQLALPGHGPFLTFLAGERQGQRIELRGGQLTVGRRADNALCLSDPYVSAHHAVIARQGGQYVLYNQSENSATFVNGQRVAQQALRPGDQVQVGTTIFSFNMPAAAWQQAMPAVNRVGDGLRGLTVGRKISGIGASLALLCFFLPWVMVSCGVQVSMSGLDLATSPGQLNAPSWLLLLVPVAALAILWVLYSALNNPRAGLLQTANRILAFAGAGLLPVILTYIGIQNARNDPENLGLGVLIHLEYGFWGTAFGFASSIVGALLDRKEAG